MLLMETEKEFLANYDSSKYEKPSVATDIVLLTVDRIKNNTLRVLMVERKNQPYQGKLALPGGFMDINESTDETVTRELYEETGVTGIYAEQLQTYTAVDRDPRMRILSVSYLALTDTEHTAQGGDDALTAKWYDLKVEESSREQVSEQEVKVTYTITVGDTNSTVNKYIRTEGRRKVFSYEIETNALSFDHAIILLNAVERLQGKLEYTDSAFYLVGEEFTLPELQKVYEIVLGRPINKSGFRNSMLREKMVLETNKMRQDGAYRPSKLYTYNPEWLFTLY